MLGTVADTNTHSGQRVKSNETGLREEMIDESVGIDGGTRREGGRQAEDDVFVNAKDAHRMQEHNTSRA